MGEGADRVDREACLKQVVLRLDDEGTAMLRVRDEHLKQREHKSHLNSLGKTNCTFASLAISMTARYSGLFGRCLGSTALEKNWNTSCKR